MRPIDLATARQYIISENNIRQIQKTQNNPQHNNNVQYQKSQNSRFTQYMPNNNFRNQQVFPSQPININPRHVAPQKYFTNKQVFGNTPNVWKPRGQKSNNFPKPTPMSGVSHGTSFNKQNNQPTNIFKNHRPNPNILVEELFNIEPNDESQYYTEDYYEEQTSENIPEDYPSEMENYYPQNGNISEQNFPEADDPPLNP